MSAIRLITLLGCAPTVQGGVGYVDETDLLLVSGRAIVAHDNETKTQRHTFFAPSALGITCLALSSNRRLYAYAEYGVDCTPEVHVHDTGSKKRKRSLTGLTHGRAPVTHLTFLADGKHLLVQTGAPDWNLHLVLWDKPPGGRVLSVLHGAAPGVRSAVVAVEPDPADANVVAICGPGIVRMLRLVDGAFKPTSLSSMRREPGPDITAMTWAAGSQLIVSHGSGELWLFDGPEFKRVLDRTVRADAVSRAAVLAAASGAHRTGGVTTDGSMTTFGRRATGASSLPVSASPASLQPCSHGPPVRCLAAFSKGFVAGCDGGLLQVYERTSDSKIGFMCVGEFVCATPDDPLPCTAAVVRLAVSTNEEELAVVTASGQIFGFRLGAYDLQFASEPPFRCLMAPLHDSGVGNAVPAAASAPIHSDVSNGGSAASGSAHLRRGLADLTASTAGAHRAHTAADDVLAIAARQPVGRQYDPWSLLSGAAMPVITGLATCVRKPWFITSGADRSVRLWSLASSHGGTESGDSASAASGGGGGAPLPEHTPQLLMVQRFDQPVTAVALHPSGHHALVACEGGVRLFNVVLGALSLVKEFHVRVSTRQDS